jgi:uncharacterized protein
MTPLFEFDSVKNEENKRRHGKDFIEAQVLWEAEHAIIPLITVGAEHREAILGEIDGKVYMAVFTRRGSALRLITFHRADSRYVKLFRGIKNETKKD